MINQKNIIDKLINVIYYTIVIKQILQPVKIVSPVFLRLAFIFGISPIFSHEKMKSWRKPKARCITMDFAKERSLMSYTNKTLAELNVLDDFLMNAIVTTPKLGEEFCRMSLSVLLQRKIGKIKVTGGSKGGNEDIRTMLNYFQNSRKENATDKATEELNEIVEQVRNLPEVRNEYMTLGDIIDCEREEAAEEAAAKALKDALISCILTYFKKQGDIPTGLQEKLEETEDTAQLQSWYELALETKEVTEFMTLIESDSY